MAHGRQEISFRRVSRLGGFLGAGQGLSHAVANCNIFLNSPPHNVDAVDDLVDLIMPAYDEFL